MADCLGSNNKDTRKQETRIQNTENMEEVKLRNYDLEKRTLEFSKRILRMSKVLPKNDVNNILINQCVRSGTSVGANYREANDALGTKDFIMRLRISRKESKETTYWLEIIIENNPEYKNRILSLHQESIELTKILSTIIFNTLKYHKNTAEESEI